MEEQKENSPRKGQIALQLYSLRNEMEKDLAGTLEKIAEIGYRWVETAFFPEGVSLEQAGQLLKQNGLSVCAIHCEFPEGEQKSKMLELAEAYDCQRMVWHGWPEDERYQTLEGTRELIDIYNEANQFAKSNGLQFGLHNHWWEFEQQPSGRHVYLELLEGLEPDVFFEIDTYWVKVAGHDPAKIVASFGSRAPLLHIKDGPAKFSNALDKDVPEPMVAVGQGTQDFPKIVAAAKGHTEWMIVELDVCATDMLTAVKDSYQYLTSNQLAI